MKITLPRNGPLQANTTPGDNSDHIRGMKIITYRDLFLRPLIILQQPASNAVLLNLVT